MRRGPGAVHDAPKHRGIGRKLFRAFAISCRLRVLAQVRDGLTICDGDFPQRDAQSGHGVQVDIGQPFPVQYV